MKDNEISCPTLLGITILFSSDDCPQGKWVNRKLPEKSVDTELEEKDEEKGVPNRGFENDVQYDEIKGKTKGKGANNLQFLKYFDSYAK